MQFDHFIIRAPEPTDANAYFLMIEHNRKRLEDFFAGTVIKNKTPEDTVHFIAEIIQKTKDRLYFPFLLINTHNKQIVGFIDVKNIDWNLPKAELGCFIDAGYEGKGLSHQALQKVIDYLFETYGFLKLFLRTHQSNSSARALAEKCGFELEGTLRSDYRTTKGELVDLLYYGLLKN